RPPGYAGGGAPSRPRTTRHSTRARRGDDPRRARSPPSDSVLHAVDRAAHRLQRGGGDVAVDPHAPQDLAVHVGLDVGGGPGVAALAQGVLAVVQDPDLDAHPGQRVHESGDRTVAGAGDLPDLAAQPDVGADAVLAVLGGLGAVRHDADRSLGQVGVGEDLPDALAAELAALGVGELLHDPGELDLEPARQVDGVVALQDVGDPALAGL